MGNKGKRTRRRKAHRIQASAIGAPERFIVAEPAIDPLPVKEQPVRVPENQPEPKPEQVPAGGE